MQILDTVQGSRIYRDPTTDIVRFIGNADIDCDGSGGNPDHDPYFQPDTTLHYHGKALNAYEVPYVVVPPIVCKKTRGKVLGCRCYVVNLVNSLVMETVVGDVGPRSKVGEMSPAAAEALGLDGNPNHGGTEDFLIYYEIYPNVPAIVGGITYDLQSYHA
jgi:hypothetical protein